MKPVRDGKGKSLATSHTPSVSPVTPVVAGDRDVAIPVSGVLRCVSGVLRWTVSGVLRCVSGPNSTPLNPVHSRSHILIATLLLIISRFRGGPCVELVTPASRLKKEEEQ